MAKMVHRMKKRRRRNIIARAGDRGGKDAHAGASANIKQMRPAEAAEKRSSNSTRQHARMLPGADIEMFIAPVNWRSSASAPRNQ